MGDLFRNMHPSITMYLSLSRSHSFYIKGMQSVQLFYLDLALRSLDIIPAAENSGLLIRVSLHAVAGGAVAPDPRVFLLPLSALLLDQTLSLATNNFAFGAVPS